MRTIHFWDTTLRDGHQSLWATRMTTEMMVPIAPTMDRAGFFNIEVGASVVFDACIHHLKEDPWERIRILRKLITKTPLSTGIRGQNVLGWDLVPDDVVDLVIPTFIRNGIRNFLIFDPMNDLRNLVRPIRLAKEGGAYVNALLVYTISPVHTDSYYAAKARELVALGADGVEIKDPSGLLTPDRIRTLAPVVREAIGSRHLHLHTHCSSGLGPLVYLEALPLGVDIFHTAISPLAHGSSNPPTELIVREARLGGYELCVDETALAEIADYFRAVAKKHNKPVGQPAAYDPALYRHQVPGGMASNLVSQLRDLGMESRLPDLLEEIVRVREELGYPIMVSPLSQFVAVQALINLLRGERYATVPMEIKKYALGWYGQLAAPIDPDVLDKITGGEAPITARPGELLEPIVERFRRENGPFESDEELILAIFYKKKVLDEYRAGKNASRVTLAATTPIETLVRELAQRPELEYVQIERGDFRLTHVA